MAKTDLVKLAPDTVDVEYDPQGDTLYIAFSHETVADESELTDNDLLLRYKGGRIIGVTILHFSERQKQRSRPS